MAGHHNSCGPRLTLVRIRYLQALDGSRLAEAVLPAAASLAQRLGARLLLLHVVERAAPEKIHGEPYLTTMEDARRSLDEHAVRMRSERVDVSVDVHECTVSDIAAAIHRRAHEFEALNAAQLFELDDVIDPAATRALIAATLATASAGAASESSVARFVDTW